MSIIITKNSATSGSVPSSLVQGELAINVTNGRLFYGSGSGNIVKEFTGSASGGGTINTGSLLTTASFSNPNLTFTKGDGSNFNVNLVSLVPTSASFASTASFAPNYVLNSATSSFVQNSQTSSFVLNSQTSSMSVASASFALTASYYNETDPVFVAKSASLATTGSNTFNGSQTINGDLIVNGTASIAFLNVTYESASVIYSSGSNQFGDASNDTQTLWGTVDIKTGPVLVTGSLNVSGGITGSLLGTASYATNALSSSYALTASFAQNAQTASYYNETDPVFVAKSASLATTGSNIFRGNQTVTGSLFTTGSNTLIGSTTLTGSLNITGSTTQIGNNTLLGNTTLSGSIIISGSTVTPTIQIYGDATHNGYIRFDPVNTNINPTISASYIYVSGSTNDLYFSQNGSGYNNVTRLRWLEGNLYTGLLHGGIITTQSSTVYQVASGSGIIVNLNASVNDDPYPTVQFLQWPNLSASIATLSASFDQSFIAINSSSAITVQGTPYENGQYNTVIPIGVAVHQNRSTINAVQTFPGVAYGWKQRSFDFIRAFGPLKISGYALSPSGSSTRSLVLSGGTAWVDGRNYTIDPNNPSYIVESTGITTSKIFRYYQSGSGWVYDTNAGAGYTTIDPTNYSLSGSLTPVGTNDWSIQRVFYFPNSGTKAFYIYYGNTTYSSKDNAIAGILTEQFNEAPNTAANAIFIGYMILRYNANFNTAASYEFRSGGLFRSAGQGGAGGGGGTTAPGGSNTQIQYNNNGVFGGVPNLTWDGTTLHATGSFSGSFTGSLLGTSSYATQALSASYASNGGVTQLLAGPNITLSPTNGLGQVTITSTGGGGVYGNTATGSYGSFYDTTTQTNPVANVNRSMSLNTTDISNGVSISGSSDPFNTYIKTINAGVYDIQFSAQLEKTSPGGTNTTYIWLRKNGTDLDETNTAFELSQNGKGVAAWNWFVNSAANDYYQIMWSSNATDTQLAASTPAYGPTVPSVIVTANRVDQFLSNTGSFSGSFTGEFTGSLQGTSSWANNAITASYALNALSASYSTNAVSASFATSASFASTVPASGVIGLSLSQIATGSVTASVSPTQFTVTSASITEFTVNGTGVTIGNATTDTHRITGSLNISGSTNINGNTIITGSFIVVTGSAVELQVTNTGVNIGNAITDTHTVTGSLNISGSTNINGNVQLTGSMFSTGSRFTFRTTGTTDALSITGSTGAYGNSVVTIDALGQANQNGLKISNIGAGDYGLELTRAGGAGSLLINKLDATPTIYTVNKNLKFWTNNNAYDSSGISFLFTDNNKTSTHQKTLLVQSSTNTLKSGSHFEIQKSGSVPILYLAGDVQSGSFSPNELYISGSLRVNSGNSTITGSLAVTNNITSSATLISGSGTNRLTVVGSGSAQPIFTIQGSQGELFSVTDSFSGSLFSVNDISGLPILEVFSDNTTLIGNYSDPMLITTTKLVTTASGAFTLYSLPTSSYDTAFFEYSIKSGSNARAGSIMAIQSGTSVNFTETTTTDFGSTSGFGFSVQVSAGNIILTGSATTSGWTIKTVIRSI
jgi:hypothetical protein